jgi:hypothetical protein
MKFATLYALSPSELGEEQAFLAEVDIVEPKGLPGAGVAALGLAALAAACLATRRR